MTQQPELGARLQPVESTAPPPLVNDMLELSVVMPLYNEEEILPACLRSWVEVLEREGIDYELRVLDDGSTDRSAAVLDDLASHPRIKGVHKPNEGHGPTILGGYQRATGSATWVFQVDSDDEIPASAFPALWRARHGNDAVFGVRSNRDQSRGRRLISAVARLSAHVFYGSAVTDANVPFRLIRADVLQSIIGQIPAETFAPNVVITGALARTGASIVEVPVPHQPRRTGTVSIVGFGALRAAVRSFFQVARLSRRFR